MVLAVSLVIYQTRALWQWLAYLGGLAGVLAILGPLGLGDDPTDLFDLLGFIAYIGVALWILLTGIGMYTKKDEPVATPARSSVMT